MDLDSGPERALSVGRWSGSGGAMLVGAGAAAGASAVAWIGVAVAVVGLVIATAGKFAHYGRLSIPRERRLRVMGAWAFLAATVAALLVDYAYALSGGAYEGFTLELALGAGGAAAVYWGVRTKYVPADGDEPSESK